MNTVVAIDSTADRLRRRARLLDLLERRRITSGDASLGSNVERMIVARELAELEEDIARDPGPLASLVHPLPVRRRPSEPAA